MTDERKTRVRQALEVLREIAWPGWTPHRSNNTPPWEDPLFVERLGYMRIAKAFVDAGWTPPTTITPPADITDDDALRCDLAEVLDWYGYRIAASGWTVEHGGANTLAYQRRPEFFRTASETAVVIGRVIWEESQ